MAMGKHQPEWQAPMGRFPAASGVKRRNAAPSFGLARKIIFSSAAALLSAGLFFIVAAYADSLRDPRYLDGWLLAGGMGLQIAFHIAVKSARLAPKSTARWRRFHVFLGYFLIAAFLSHIDFSLPDTGMEWALWVGFLTVTLSGVVGTYLTWSLSAKSVVDDDVRYERIPTLRAALARDLTSIVSKRQHDPAAQALPARPYDEWITDLYTGDLRDFFDGPRNFSAHLVGSQRPLKRLTDEIDNLSRYVDPVAQEKLAAIKHLVTEKDRLDAAFVTLSLTKGWLFIHVPVTYALIVLTIAHIIVVYAFASGSG